MTYYIFYVILLYYTGKTKKRELLGQAHAIIARFTAEPEKGETIDENAIQKLLSDLENNSQEINLISSLLVAAKKQGEYQQLEEIKGLTIKEVGASELSDDPVLADRLKQMYESANAHKTPADLARLLADFDNHKLHDPKFYLLYFDQNGGQNSEADIKNLVDFARSSAFDGRSPLAEGERYLGALNVGPLLRRFYLSENFTKEMIDKKITAGARKLITHAPKNGASHKILASLDFQVLAQEGEYENPNDKAPTKRLRLEWQKKQ